MALAAGLLLLSSPLLLAIALGIRVADPGPVFYRAERAGMRGVLFRMYKFRTMRSKSSAGARIAGRHDPRVFAFGAVLRSLKLDELPQLLNIVRGEMAFVGPRPEDPWFVEHIYTEVDRETLDVLPGLTSPGTLYYLVHAEPFLDDADTEASYVAGPLKKKLALDLAYIRRASAASDMAMVLKTIWVLARTAAGRPC